MSILKEKSKQNEKAATLLLSSEISCSPSIIHCLYYSIFQLSKHILANHCGKSYIEQNKESNNIDSHKYIMNAMASSIDKISHIDFLDYLSKFEKLKRLRKKADYNNEQITESDVQKAQEHFKKLNVIFNKNYKIL